MIQFILFVLLFFIIFFMLAFILNMLLRQTWLMSYLYLIVVIMIVDKIATVSYFTNTKYAFTMLYEHMSELQLADIAILTSGLIGTIVSGFVIKYLRKGGYQMF